MDLSGVRAAGAQFGAAWAVDPNGTLNGSLRVLIGFTLIGGILGFLIGNWLGDTGLWLSYSKVFFWFSSLLLTAMILGVTVVGRGTRRGTLTFLFLGGSVAFMVWSYIL